MMPEKCVSALILLNAERRRKTDLRARLPVVHSTSRSCPAANDGLVPHTDVLADKNAAACTNGRNAKAALRRWLMDRKAGLGRSCWSGRDRLAGCCDAANGSKEPYLTEVLAQFRTASRYMPNGRLSRIINTIDALTAAAISEAVAPAKASVTT